MMKLRISAKDGRERKLDPADAIKRGGGRQVKRQKISERGEERRENGRGGGCN